LTKKSNSGTSYEFSSKNTGIKRITLVFSGSQIHGEQSTQIQNKKLYTPLISYFQNTDVEITYFLEEEKVFQKEEEKNEANLSKGTNSQTKKKLQNISQVYTGAIKFESIGLKIYFDERFVLRAGQKVVKKDLIGIKLTSDLDIKNQFWYRNIFDDFQFKRISRMWGFGLLVINFLCFLKYLMDLVVKVNNPVVKELMDKYSILGIILGLLLCFC
jgi:hypothetical protein